jgi:hypothetical protein
MMGLVQVGIEREVNRDEVACHVMFMSVDDDELSGCWRENGSVGFEKQWCADV